MKYGNSSQLGIWYNNNMKSIYDIKLNSCDGEADFLGQYKGKVTLVVNTTTDCGNAPQFAPLQKLRDKYFDQGFDIVAIPTNDYCGPTITYGKWADGIKAGSDSRDFATEEYNVSYKFSEMVSSNPGPGSPNAEEKTFGEPHELYKEIQSQMQLINSNNPEQGGTGTYMFGNFEKYLVNRDGYVVKHFVNGTLINYSAENGANGSPVQAGTDEEEFNNISRAIEELL